jgi:hypothetical protein
MSLAQAIATDQTNPQPELRDAEFPSPVANSTQRGVREPWQGASVSCPPEQAQPIKRDDDASQRCRGRPAHPRRGCRARFRSSAG